MIAVVILLHCISQSTPIGFHVRNISMQIILPKYFSHTTNMAVYRNKHTHTYVYVCNTYVLCIRSLPKECDMFVL